MSLNTGTASWHAVRQALQQAQTVPGWQVRPEEFINAIDFHYHRPAADATFAVSATTFADPFVSDAEQVQIGIKAADMLRRAGKPVRLSLLIDVSGSMNDPQRLPLVQQTVEQLLTSLAPDDRVQIGWFADELMLSEWQNPDQAATYVRAYRSQNQRSTTSCTTSRRRQHQHGRGTRTNPAQSRRRPQPTLSSQLIVISDGIAGMAPTAVADLQEQISQARQRGISTSTVSVGVDPFAADDDADTMASLAQHGDGQHYMLQGAKDIAPLVKELSAARSPIARDARIQVSWDATRVQRWQQVGYRERIIADERFRDDSIDAGEVLSGQAATAIYRVHSNAAPGETIATVAIRWRDSNGSMQEMSAPVILNNSHGLSGPRHLGLTPVNRQLQAAVAATFAEILAGERQQPSAHKLLQVLQQANQITARSGNQRTRIINFTSR